MKKDFITALMRKRYNIQTLEDVSKLSDIDRLGFEFASTTNERGAAFLTQCEGYGFDFDGLNVLDIGCAYGGFSLEAAKCGATVYGIDINSDLIEYAKLNSWNESLGGGAVQYFQCDATSIDFLKLLPHKRFDLVIINDVFEHIYDTAALLKNLNAVANDRCAVYFEIPNPHYIPFAFKEPHLGRDYLSLLPPFLWHKYLEVKDYSIYYRRFEYYCALLNYFGFGTISYLNYPDFADTSTGGKIKELYRKADKIPDGSDASPYLSSFEDMVEYDVSTGMAYSELHWKYLTDFWRGFAQRVGCPHPPANIERKFQMGFGELVFQFSQGMIEVRIDTEKEIQAQYTIFRRTYLLFDSPFQPNKFFRFELCCGGPHSVLVKIKTGKHEYEVNIGSIYNEYGKCYKR